MNIIFHSFTILAHNVEDDYEKIWQQSLTIKEKIQNQQNLLNNEINVAKKLKTQIDSLLGNHELPFNNLFDKVIQETESQEPTSLINQFNQSVMELDQLPKESKKIENLNPLKEKLDNLLTQYNEQLISIVKYNTKSIQELTNFTKNKVEKIFDIIEIFLTPPDEELKLTQEVRQDITNKEIDGALGSFHKGIQTLINVEKEMTFDKQLIAYNTAKFHFTEALQKYQNTNKLKKLFSYVLGNQELKSVYDKKFAILNAQSGNYKSMIQWLYIFGIFLIFIFILAIMYMPAFYDKNKKK
ncbi:hypothetical protein AlmWB_00570 [Candidatus Phytoplasma phoenicium]|uniref:Uncharacterized protein n=1 Tax=Candidatus Phytoplasma phoenicium TaxID=198422 RepID=A0A0L0ML65_9MOLU|nr:hypothetical protein AlmWB_00570 [Candidatus Phytoplasma phoenicium]